MSRRRSRKANRHHWLPYAAGLLILIWLWHVAAWLLILAAAGACVWWTVKHVVNPALAAREKRQAIARRQAAALAKQQDAVRRQAAAQARHDEAMYKQVAARKHDSSKGRALRDDERLDETCPF
jgi:hypothetical protein